MSRVPARKSPQRLRESRHRRRQSANERRSSCRQLVSSEEVESRESWPPADGAPTHYRRSSWCTIRIRSRSRRCGAEVPAIESVAADVVAAADYVFLALHPPALPGALAEIKPLLQRDAILVSLAPKVPIAMLEQLAGTRRVARMIPNAPSIIGQGCTSRRVLISSTTKTYMSRKLAVTVTKKSHASTSRAWFRRNVLQTCVGAPRPGGTGLAM
jgi:hypothetical protein